MNKEFPEIQKLLEMRGDAAPADEYFEEFLEEFHRRQRQDLMRRSARSLLFERINVWVREMGNAKWIYGAGAAYALLMVGFFVWPKDGSGNDLIEPVSWEEKVLHFEPDSVDESEPPKPAEF